jgi:FKBP-type peptidyl-prolyl cis-trans isomerase (trigger factor)
LFILRRLADHFQIEVSEQEINGRIASIAAHRGLRPDQVRAELTQMGRLSEVGHLIRQQKAADRVIAEAKVTGVPVADWRADRADAASEGKGKSKTAGKPKKTTGAKDASPKTSTKKKTSGSRKT